MRSQQPDTDPNPELDKPRPAPFILFLSGPFFSNEFANTAKSTCHVMSCLSICLNTCLPICLSTCSNSTPIGWIFATAYTGEFYYICWKNRILFKIRQKYGHFTWRRKSIFWQYLTQSPTPVMRAHRGCNRSKAMTIRFIHFTHEMYECASYVTLYIHVLS
jgi:hypothetical protein